MQRLTKPLLRAMASALASALAGDFDDGDFAGLDRVHFERAHQWVGDELDRREQESKKGKT